MAANLAPVPAALPEQWWFVALRGLLLMLGTHIHLVNGNPNGAEYGMAGDLALRLGGAAGSTLYTKESGTAAIPTNTNWRAV